jgi:hypothetical protein
VANGTYHEHNIDFLGKSIIVMSTEPEDSATVATTIVDGDSMGSVFDFSSGEDTASVLAGFTITNGYAFFGGGISCDGSSPRITNCAFRKNSSFYDGGGMSNSYGSSPIVTNCRFNKNSANWGDGGGICNY